MTKGQVVLALVLADITPFLKGATLGTDTERAWSEYITAADMRIQPRLNGKLPFLWTDESRERRQRVLAGEVVTAPMIANGVKAAGNGLIHDWIGAIFIPNTTIEQLTAVLHEYDRYRQYFAPFVAESRRCASSPSTQEFALIFQYRVVFGNVVFATRYTTHDFAVGPRRHYSIANTMLVQEVQGYGSAAERRLEPGTGTGFVWKLHSIARYEERDGGVFVEMEALALTRNIPGALRWFVAPMVKRMSINSLESALTKTRRAVTTTNPASEIVARGGR